MVSNLIITLYSIIKDGVLSILFDHVNTRSIKSIENIFGNIIYERFRNVTNIQG
jgi:hypothetical protein